MALPVPFGTLFAEMEVTAVAAGSQRPGAVQYAARPFRRLDIQHAHMRHQMGQPLLSSQGAQAAAAMIVYSSSSRPRITSVFQLKGLSNRALPYSGHP